MHAYTEIPRRHIAPTTAEYACTPRRHTSVTPEHGHTESTNSKHTHTHTQCSVRVQSKPSTSSSNNGVAAPVSNNVSRSSSSLTRASGSLSTAPTPSLELHNINRHKKGLFRKRYAPVLAVEQYVHWDCTDCPCKACYRLRVIPSISR
jgi:hypothetical protein